MSETFTHNGHDFTVTIEHDTDMRHPWEEHDGHGVVRESRQPHYSYCSDKKPWERPLNHANRHECQFYYDMRATLALAKKDSWGVSPEVIEAYTANHGKPPTPRQITAMAVEADFQYLRKYIAGDVAWYWVRVTHAESGEYESLGGILCEDGDAYLMECARELAREICYTLDQREKTLDLHMAGL